MILVAAFAAAGCASAPQRTAEGPRVQQDVEVMIRALYRGDVETVLRFTHPAIVAKLGGLDRAQEAMAPIVQQAQQARMRIESLAFPAAPDFLAGEARTFVVVPTLLVMASGAQRAESRNYQLGVRDDGGAQWYWIEGSRIRAENVRELFPDFPADYRFPPVWRKKL